MRRSLWPRVVTNEGLQACDAGATFIAKERPYLNFLAATCAHCEVQDDMVRLVGYMQTTQRAINLLWHRWPVPRFFRRKNAAVYALCFVGANVVEWIASMMCGERWWTARRVRLNVLAVGVVFIGCYMTPSLELGLEHQGLFNKVLPSETSRSVRHECKLLRMYGPWPYSKGCRVYTQTYPKACAMVRWLRRQHFSTNLASFSW